MSSRDLAADPIRFAFTWGLPAAALIAAIWLAHPAKTIIWGAALTWMGVACLMNAARCRRVHCHFTGPYYLALAVLSVLHGYRILYLGVDGWTALGFAIAVGTFVIWTVSELVAGRYFGPSEHDGKERA